MSDLPKNLVRVLLRRLDERTACIEDRLATIERRMALRDQKIVIDRIWVSHAPPWRPMTKSNSRHVF